MHYELHEYTAVPGAAQSLHTRFADHVLALMKRNGMEVLGLWHDRDDDAQIVYLLRFSDEAAGQTAWASFQNDPEWKRVKKESEADGPILAEKRRRILTAPPYAAPLTTREGR